MEHKEKIYHLLSKSILQVLIVLIPVFLYGLLLSIALPRQIGLSLRYGFTSTIIILFCSFFIVFQIKKWPGKLLSLSVVLLVFALPLSGLWASGQSEQYLLGGLLPFSDARNYHVDAMRVLEGMEFTSFSGRRPLFPALLTFVLFLTGQNLQIALAFFVALVAVSCYLLVREVQKHFGSIAAVYFLVILFLFFRPLIGKALTENLGFSAAVIGLVFLWRSVQDKSRWWEALIGMFFTSLALNARAGAFFVLPALAIWGAWYFKEGKWFSKKLFGFSMPYFVLSIAAIGAGFMVNMLVFRILVPQGMAFSNFSQTFYGMVTGGNSWTQIFMDHPEVWTMEEPEQSQTIFRYSFEVLRENPGLIVIGAFKSWGMFFSPDGYYGAFCFVGGDTGFLSIFSRIAMFLLSALGIVYWFKNRSDGIGSLIVFSAIGILLSIPFVPPLDANRMRAYAATMPLFLGLQVLGVQYILKSILKDKRFSFLAPPETNTFTGLIALSVGLLCFTILGPLFVQIVVQRPDLETVSCEDGLTGSTVRISDGSYVELVPLEKIDQDWMPEIRINRFRDGVHNLPNWEYHSRFAIFDPNTVLTNAVEMETGLFQLLVLESEMLPENSNVLQICGKPDEELRIFYVDFAREIVLE